VLPQSGGLSARRLQDAGREGGVVVAGSTAALTGMTVNTSYRVERRVSATSRVVLLSRGVAGVVRIHAGLEISAGEPVVRCGDRTDALRPRFPPMCQAIV
jgi:hypothetical protein